MKNRIIPTIRYMKYEGKTLGATERNITIPNTKRKTVAIMSPNDFIYLF